MKQKTTEKHLIKAVPLSFFDKVNCKDIWQFPYVGGLFYVLTSQQPLRYTANYFMGSEDF